MSPLLLQTNGPGRVIVNTKYYAKWRNHFH